MDDFTVNHMDQENWLYAVSLIVENVFFPEEIQQIENVG